MIEKPIGMENLFLPEDNKHEIMHVGSPIIRTRSKPAANHKQGAVICEMLTEKLRELQGAGLAAPQMGIPYRVFVVEVRKTLMFPDREESPLYEVINPKLEYLSKDELIEFEGCFSVPGYVGQVPRARKVKLYWTSPEGSKRSEVFEGYLARVFQHEFDHLNGCLYLDRMPDMSSLSTRENYMRARLENERFTLKRLDADPQA